MNALDKFIKGTCEKMCPDREREMREREGLLHNLEMLQGTERMKRPRADPERIVKEYCRSAAGQRMPKSSDLRPLMSLTATVQYLLRLAYHPSKLEWSTVYDFVADRLRAVRQDLVMQGLDGFESLPLFESMVLFHVYASYRLSDCGITVFDPKLNNDWLLDCLKRSLTLYDLGAESKNQGLIETLYGIVGFGNNEACRRFAALPQKRQSKQSRLAYDMLLSFEIGNFVRGFRLLHCLSLPLMCAVSQHLPVIRRKAIQVLNVAYSSKVLKVPSDVVTRWLDLPSSEAAVNECSYYGLQCDPNNINFQKSSLKELKTIQCSKLSFLDKKLKECDDLTTLFSVV